MNNFQYQMLIKVESPGARGERIINYNKSKIWKMSIPCITNSIHTLKLNSIQLKEQKKQKEGASRTISIHKRISSNPHNSRLCYHLNTSTNIKTEGTWMLY